MLYGRRFSSSIGARSFSVIRGNFLQGRCQRMLNHTSENAVLRGDVVRVGLGPCLEAERCFILVIMRTTQCEATFGNEIFPSDGWRPLVPKALFKKGVVSGTYTQSITIDTHGLAALALGIGSQRRAVVHSPVQGLVTQVSMRAHPRLPDRLPIFSTA